MTGTTSGKRRVLIVEDEAIIAMLVEDMLRELGYDIAGLATRLDTALEFAASSDIDIAVLDVNVNGAEVYPVVEVLIARGVPFIFATGYGALGLWPDLRSVPILQKPFTVDQLSLAIRQASEAAAGA